MGVLIIVVALVVLPVLVLRFVVWPPRSWHRWRRTTRPIRRVITPWRYDRNGRPKVGGSDHTRTVKRFASPSSFGRRSPRA